MWEFSKTSEIWNVIEYAIYKEIGSYTWENIQERCHFNVHNKFIDHVVGRYCNNAWECTGNTDTLNVITAAVYEGMGKAHMRKHTGTIPFQCKQWNHRPYGSDIP